MSDDLFAPADTAAANATTLVDSDNLEAITSAARSRVVQTSSAWVSAALTRVKIIQAPGTELSLATLARFPKCAALAATEADALRDIGDKLASWAEAELLAGRSLPAWECKTVAVPPEARLVVRVSRLKKTLLRLAAEWNVARQKIPSSALDECLAEIYAVINRHAMRMKGVS